MYCWAVTILASLAKEGWKMLKRIPQHLEDDSCFTWFDAIPTGVSWCFNHFLKASKTYGFRFPQNSLLPHLDVWNVYQATTGHGLGRPICKPHMRGHASANPQYSSSFVWRANHALLKPLRSTEWYRTSVESHLFLKPRWALLRRAEDFKPLGSHWLLQKGAHNTICII